MGRRGGRGEKGREEENMRKWDSQDRGRVEKKNKARDLLIEGALAGEVAPLIKGLLHKHEDLCSPCGYTLLTLALARYRLNAS